MSEKNDIKELMTTIFNGMDGLISSKTVVGEPVKVGDATLVPLIEVSMGMGAGGFNQDRDKKKGDAGAGAMSSKITPTAMLVLQRGNVKLVNIKNQDALTKLLDVIPDAVDKITGGNRITKDAQREAERRLEEGSEGIHSTETL